MKIINICFLFLVMGMVISCSDDEKDYKVDYSKLGLQQLSINDQVLELAENGFPVNLDDHENIGLVSTSETNILTYGLAYVSNNVSELNIELKSKYDDLTTKITKTKTDSKHTYLVQVSRSGTVEQVIYTINVIQPQ